MESNVDNKPWELWIDISVVETPERTGFLSIFEDEVSAYKRAERTYSLKYGIKI